MKKWLLACTAALTVPMFGATYNVPPDAELIQNADDIVVATGVRALAERTDNGVVTRFTLRVEETLKGTLTPGEELVLTERGGILPDGGRLVFGAPRYETGVRYLVFASMSSNLERTTLGMSLGQFELTGKLASRRDIHGFDQNLDAHVERPRDAARFLRYVRDIVAQRSSDASYFSEAPQMQTQTAAVPISRASYTGGSDGRGVRWKVPSAGWVRNGEQPGADAAQAFSKAIEQWNGTDSNIEYHDAGIDYSPAPSADDENALNMVIFNDARDLPKGSGYVAGYAIAHLGAIYAFDGELFLDITGGDIAIKEGPRAQNCLNSLVAHELGHTLGFRHSETPVPPYQCATNADCTSKAIMVSGLGNEECGYNGVLQRWDRDAAVAVYGAGPTCSNPLIKRQPESEHVRKGLNYVIWVVADSREPTRYQWYEGARGDTSRPIGSDSMWFTTPKMTRSMLLWVRVTDICGSTDSETATLSIATRRRSSGH